MRKRAQAAITVYSLIFIASTVFLLCAGSSDARADDLYLGRRWGFSQLTATPVSDIAWSGDGKFLFFTLVGDETSYIYRIKDVWKIKKGRTLPGTLRPEKIMEVRGKIMDFSLAPDRLVAAYAISEGAEYAGLYVANLATGQTMRITQGRGPRWSPQGGRIAFYFFGKKRLFGIATINVDGSGLRSSVSWATQCRSGVLTERPWPFSLPGGSHQGTQASVTYTSCASTLSPQRKSPRMQTPSRRTSRGGPRERRSSSKPIRALK
jgi:Tol biopolymer transport system component